MRVLLADLRVRARQSAPGCPSSSPARARRARPSARTPSRACRAARARPAPSRCPWARSRAAPARRAAPTRRTSSRACTRRASSSITRTPAATSCVPDRLRLRQHGLPPVAAGNRHDHHLDGRDARRQHEARVVAVGHDQPADQPRRDAPRRRPHVLQRLVAALELDVEGLGEVLAEVVRGARLQRPAVAHQRLDRVGLVRAGELLGRRSSARDHRHRELGLGEVP